MLICKNCKTEAPDGEYFCEKCGEPLQSQAETAAVPETGFCASCGAKTVRGTKFCPNCGAKQPQAGNAMPNTGVAAPVNSPNSISFSKPAVSGVVGTVPTPPRRPDAGRSFNKLDTFSVTVQGSGFRLLTGGLITAGKLDVYSDRVEFRPGMINMMDDAIVMPMDEIAAVKIVNVAIAIPNGVQIVMRNGKEYVFCPKAWEKTRLIELINAQLHRI